MLCSHGKKFIYFKTRKTAGTPVEIFFQKFCAPEGMIDEEAHGSAELVTEAGIIGSRREGRSPDDAFHNHMPAEEIREKLGRKIFESYFKFCVIRNPYDAQVSKFWWRMRKQETAQSPETLSFAEIKKAFNEFIKSQKKRLARDRAVYMIDNVPVMDKFIRFENLHQDLADTCNQLKIEYAPGMLGNYKSGFKKRPEHFSEYYDEQTREIVGSEFKWEIARFGYGLCLCAVSWLDQILSDTSWLWWLPVDSLA